MSSQFSEETEDTAIYSKNAAETHRRIRRPRHANSLGDFAAIVALSIAFCTLLLISLQTTPAQPVAVQTFELPPRPIWINSLPFAPVDGLVPDFGQPHQPQQRTVKPD